MFACHTLTCITYVTHLKSAEHHWHLKCPLRASVIKGQLFSKMDLRGGVTPSQKSSESGLCDMKANFMFRPHDLHLKLSRDLKDWDYVKIKFRFQPVKLLESDWLKSKNYLQC